MSEETEGDMAAAELEAEAERDNTPAPLPPCGPARDVVAEAREEIVAMGRELAEALYVEHPANARKREREVTIAGELADALITAARADERAQWAARATDKEREMVGQFGAINILCGVANAQGNTQRARDAADEADRLSATLLAALTAARGKADKSLSDGYALGLKQRAEELAANKRLLDTAHVALTAARERAIEQAAALCDTALKTIPPKSDAAAEVLHLAGRIRALTGRKGEA